ncbi:MAG: hypothetical protein IKA39_01560, partial [Clostridia bacterium]|nr:hypothetical protein [Clostridia bacterium]
NYFLFFPWISVKLIVQSIPENKQEAIFTERLDIGSGTHTIGQIHHVRKKTSGHRGKKYKLKRKKSFLITFLRVSLF